MLTASLNSLTPHCAAKGLPWFQEVQRPVDQWFRLLCDCNDDFTDKHQKRKNTRWRPPTNIPRSASLNLWWRWRHSVPQMVLHLFHKCRDWLTNDSDFGTSVALPSQISTEKHKGAMAASNELTSMAYHWQPYQDNHLQLPGQQCVWHSKVGVVSVLHTFNRQQPKRAVPPFAVTCFSRTTWMSWKRRMLIPFRNKSSLSSPCWPPHCICGTCRVLSGPGTKNPPTTNAWVQ